MPNISLTKRQVEVLTEVVDFQLDLLNDTVLDDLYVRTESELTMDKLDVIRESTNERIDLLVILTHTSATLQSFINGGDLYIKDDDVKSFVNNIECYIGMRKDMLKTDDFDQLRKDVEFIRECSVVLSIFNNK